MLKEVSIYNFKCLHAAENLAVGKMTLLTGVNGRGKSSFLQSLLVLSQTWRKSNYDVLIPSDPDLVSLGSYPNIHNIAYADSPMRMHFITDDEDDNDFEVAYRRSSAQAEIGELIDFKVGGKSPMGDEGTEENIEEEEGEEEAFEDKAMSTPLLTSLSDHPSLMALKNIYYVAANRQPAPDRYTTKEGTGYFTLHPDGSNVLEAMMRLGSHNLERLENMLKEIFGSANISIGQKANNSPIILMMSSDDKGPLFTPTNVGYGYSYILTMLTALLMMKENDILIIENPEAHLHPGAQAEVMRLLTEETVKRRLQVFIETHSDHIVNGALIGVRQREDFSNEDLAILFFDNNHVTNLEITPRGHILNPPKGFGDQYARDLDILYPINEWEE